MFCPSALPHVGMLHVCASAEVHSFVCVLLSSGRWVDLGWTSRSPCPALHRGAMRLTPTPPGMLKCCAAPKVRFLALCYTPSMFGGLFHRGSSVHNSFASLFTHRLHLTMLAAWIVAYSWLYKKPAVFVSFCLRPDLWSCQMFYLSRLFWNWRRRWCTWDSSIRAETQKWNKTWHHHLALFTQVQFGLFLLLFATF